jgi:hypothetical protein
MRLELFGFLSNIALPYFLSVVAFGAVEIEMLPFQHVSCQRVIKRFRVDLSHCEISSVVLLVAIDALLILVPAV